MSALNPEQFQAVTHKEGPLLVLAGAGSGKTRIVTYRIVHLIQQGISPSEILAVTFTNKAAKEMLERVRIMTQGSLSLPLISTFHSLGAYILREIAPEMGYTKDFVIYDEDDSMKLLKQCVQTLNIKTEENQLKGFKSLLSHMKNELFAPEEISQEELASLPSPHFREIYRLYQERLKACNAFDFDDLLFVPVRLFQTKKEILAEYQRKWRYLFIDEYQDTNKAQYTLSRLIVEKTHNIFVVGDPDQSIYSWRGANIQNILNFERDYPGAKIVRLEQNYRSKKNILDAANALIEHNRSRYKKKLWSDRGEGEKISLYVAPTEREEAFFVVDEIDKLHRAFKIPLKEIAILYRTNFQSRSFEDFLLRKKIPYTIVGGISFYQRKEIKDILSFLHMVHSDFNEIAFFRTLNLPKRGFGEVAMEKIKEGTRNSGLPILKYCQIGDASFSEKQKKNLKDYVEMILELRDIAITTSLQKLLIETIKKTGYLEILREEKETFEDRKANLDELIAKGAEWDLLHEEEMVSLSSFLEELSLKSSLDQADFSDDKLSLMTLHNGKGLEFSSVFLVGMEEDLFPHANARDSYEAVEEERRLCYVGMTRAKERLFLTAAERRFLWGTSRMMRPSRFLREIPREFIDRMR